MTTQRPAIENLQSQRVAARGELVAALVDGRTRVSRLYQEGAAKMRLPQQAGPSLEAVLINTAGGLTGGDRLSWEVEARTGTSVTVTTQACERAYRSAGGHAELRSRIAVRDGATLAWLPQETILYDRSALQRSLEIDLAPDARTLIVEPVILGRRAYGETVQLAHFRDRWRVRVAGRLVHAEDFALGPSVERRIAREVVTGGALAFATILLVGRDAEAHAEPLRTIVGDAGGVSHWHVGGTGKLLARLVAQDAYALRRRLVPALELLNGQAPLPKLWSL
ncbi:MAG: urease accessory protein UreD [Rhizobiaceae bacterium]|nr:urease accessory protein UreD [Rhizobiaceae bacterium]